METGVSLKHVSNFIARVPKYGWVRVCCDLILACVIGSL